jgi:hypothetical protein
MVYFLFGICFCLAISFNPRGYGGVTAGTRAGILKQSMGARNRVGIGLSHRPARQHRLAEFIPWNQFLGSINV